MRTHNFTWVVVALASVALTAHAQTPETPASAAAQAQPVTPTAIVVVLPASATEQSPPLPKSLTPLPPPPSPREAERETGGEAAALAAALAADAATPATVSTPAAAGPVASAIQSMNPDIALILNVAGAGFNTREPMPLGAHDPTHTGFNLQQVELALGANVDPYFRLDSNIVLDDEEVEVEEAYGTTLALPAGLQARGGKFLTRFGRINSTHPHSWSFVDQPLVLGKFFGGEGSRGLGAELSWLTPLPWYLELVGSMHDSMGETAPSYVGEYEDFAIHDPADLLYTTALKQFFALSDAWGLSWGLSGQFGPNAGQLSNGHGYLGRTTIFGTDLYLRYRPPESRSAVSLTIEALQRRRELPADTFNDWGLYSQLVWNINPAWELGGRYEWVTGYAGDDTHPDWSGARARQTLQATFYPSHFSRLRLQGNRDKAAWTDETIYGVFVAVELLIGAHGAHTY